MIHNLQVAHVLLVAQLIRGADGRGRPGAGGTAGTVASGARGTGRGGVSTRRGACAVPGGGNDEKLFAKDMRVAASCRLLRCCLAACFAL